MFCSVAGTAKIFLSNNENVSITHDNSASVSSDSIGTIEMLYYYYYYYYNMMMMKMMIFQIVYVMLSALQCKFSSQI